MKYKVNGRKVVRYELMLGLEAMEAIRECPVGYLPVGGMERHGDHLPMGLDVIKAHGICCLAAQAIGGVVFPPHYYSAIHKIDRERLRKLTGEWGDIFTDATTKSHLIDIIGQLELMPLEVLVLYSGHYPRCQVEMIEEIADEINGNADMTVIPFAECMILTGDHAGVSETSLMMYLDKHLVDMTRIREINYRNHGWGGENDPKLASAARGESEVERVIDHLKEKIERLL